MNRRELVKYAGAALAVAALPSLPVFAGGDQVIPILGRAWWRRLLVSGIMRDAPLYDDLVGWRKEFFSKNFADVLPTHAVNVFDWKNADLGNRPRYVWFFDFERHIKGRLDSPTLSVSVHYEPMGILGKSAVVTASVGLYEEGCKHYLVQENGEVFIHDIVPGSFRPEFVGRVHFEIDRDLGFSINT